MRTSPSPAASSVRQRAHSRTFGKRPANLARRSLTLLCLMLLNPAGGAWTARAQERSPVQKTDPAGPAAAPKPAGPERWEADIRRFEEQDAQNPPPKQGIVFVGSSSIRMWDVRQSFPGLPVVNRGFGGSTLPDAVHFVDRLVLKHEPRIIVLYAGDNDLARGRTPEQVVRDFQTFLHAVRTGKNNVPGLAETRIVFIAIKPSLARWKLIDSIRQANAGIREICERNRRLTFVDIDGPMLGHDGTPRPELFLKDGLHLTAEGYRVWTSLVRPHLTGVDPAGPEQ